MIGGPLVEVPHWLYYWPSYHDPLRGVCACIKTALSHFPDQKISFLLCSLRGGARERKSGTWARGAYLSDVMDTFLGGRPPTTQAGLAFRVECHDRTSKVYNMSLVRGGLGGMTPRRDRFVGGSFEVTSELRLMAAHEATPFVPFWSSWEKALQWRDWMLENGGKDIVVVVVWLGGMPGVYDSQDMAKWVEYRRGSGHGRRPIEYHQDELLVFGGIPAAEHRVLACIKGDSPYLLDSRLPGVQFPAGATAVFPDPDGVMIWLMAWMEGAEVWPSDEADLLLLLIGVSLARRGPGS